MKTMNKALEQAANDYIDFPQEPEEDLTTFERRKAFKAGADGDLINNFKKAMEE